MTGDLGPFRRIADIGGTGLVRMPGLTGPGITIDIIDIDRQGRWGQGGELLRARTATLCPTAEVRLVTTASDLSPCDLTLNLGLFGDTAKVTPLASLLPVLMKDGGRLLTDIRKGSGAWPFLKGFGTVATLDSGAGDPAVTRVVVTPRPKPARGDWDAIARDLAGPDGFFHQGTDHSMLFVPRGETLVVTFDNLDIAMEKRDDRRPWGYAFIEKQGWSMLGVMANGWTWYRDPWVTAEFDRLRQTGFFARFSRVVFYGASMGGYAACAFAAACPGADAVAISPQSTLDKRIVPWETRYAAAWGRDFTGPYGDAAMASQSAGRVILLHDPYAPLDAAHVARFDGPNVLKLRAPLLGHRLGSSLQQMGVLSDIITGALDGTLTEAQFYRLLRARRTSPRYQREIFRRALARGHPVLARRLADWILARGNHPYIRRARAALDAPADSPSGVNQPLRPFA